jgi:hypothetical protein
MNEFKAKLEERTTAKARTRRRIPRLAKTLLHTVQDILA